MEDRSADDLVDSPKSSFHLPTENGTSPKSTVNGGPSCSVPPIPGTVMVYWWHLDCPSIIGASLSEPHIDGLNARDPYIYIIIIIITRSELASLAHSFYTCM